MTIGILAIQGDFARHQKILQRLGVASALVKSADELNACAGLIIPGGESTTLTIVMQKHGLWQEVKEFAAKKPVFGTCAGLIIMASNVLHHDLSTLGLINMKVLRNAYGRQIDSFIDKVSLRLRENGAAEQIEGAFIRAPKILELGAGAQAKGWHDQEIVLAENSHILAAAFHPEISGNAAIHKYFVEKIRSLS